MSDSDFAALLRAAAEDPPELPRAGDGTLFDEEPVSLSVFVQDRNYLNNPPLSPVQYQAVRHIERVYYPSTYTILADLEKPHLGATHIGPGGSFTEQPYWSQPVRMTNFVTLQWGKGGGKDHVVRIASMRIAYLLMCLRSPQNYYQLPEQDTIHLLNVASSSQQAQQAFFMPITRAVKRGWFAGHCQARQNVISYAKGIESISGHSDAETQEGLNLMLGIADEIDAFKSKKEMASRRGTSAREPSTSAEGILEMMHTSGSTRFPGIYKQVRISFPRYKGSMIQRLTAEAVEDVDRNGIDSRHYVSGPLATWEVNPRVPGKEAFAEDYKRDPVMARSKYECRPSRAHNPYFRNYLAVDSAFRPVEHEPLAVDYGVEQGRGGRKVWVPRYDFGPQLYPVRGAAYAMHADMAVTGDRAGLAMAHVARYSEHETWSDDDDEGVPHPVRETRPHVTVDFVVHFSADPSTDPPREIQIRWARQLCFELIRRGFNIKQFSFDGFQSRDSMQILEDKGIDTDRVSTDTCEDPWRTLRDLMYEGRLSIPRLAVEPGTTAPPLLLRDELLSLTRLPNGRIDHPSDGSKDEADALACAVLGAIAVGGAEEDDGARAYLSGPAITVGEPIELPFGASARNLFLDGLNPAEPAGPRWLC